MTARILLLLCVSASSAAFAEDAKARAAREELERQLSQMVGQQPTKVRLEYAGLDEPNYGIEEAVFEVDGRVVGSPSVSALSEEGRHLVWNGDVSPGKHVVKVLLVFANATSAVLSDEGGYKWRVGGSVGFDVHAGIEVRVTVIPKRDPSQVDVARRFKLALPAEPVMLARLDDGKMPEPARPVAPAPLVDPAPLPPPLVAVVVEPKAQAPTARSAEAKLVAGEERRRAVEEAAEGRRLPAEDTQREVEQDAGSKPRAAAGGPQVIAQAASPPSARPDAGASVADSPVPLGAVAAPGPVARAEPGAGTPVAAAPTTAMEESQPPWLVIGLGVGALLLSGLIVLARRAARPPTLDD
jgi:hypothetical protein